MPEPEIISHDSRHLYPSRGRLHRTSPAHPATSRHQHLAGDPSLRPNNGASPAKNTRTTSPPSRTSSGESHESSNSEPKKWFDQSNRNSTVPFDSNDIDVDTAFLQEPDSSSIDDQPYQFTHRKIIPLCRTVALPSSAGGYRSVIDDLTVEIQKLTEELKRYKQDGPDLLRAERLFEVKIYGLAEKKKHELHATLETLAASLGSSLDASSSQHHLLGSNHTTLNHMYPGTSSNYASTRSDSKQKFMNSAYASVSTGATTSGSSFRKPSMSSSAGLLGGKDQHYLRDIPNGLYHHFTMMNDEEKKQFVVSRLEQLFTDKISGRENCRGRPSLSPTSDGAREPTLVTMEGQGAQHSTVDQPPILIGQPAREARILAVNQQPSDEHKKSQRNGIGCMSTWDGEQRKDNLSSSTNMSPPHALLIEQRPTWPTELDPDRIQVPSENRDYIKHLGLTLPGLSGGANDPTQHSNSDAEDGVYLNLLCNLAQLHFLNVTPSFVRSAVSDMSTKLRLSSDGRKVRWCGGTEVMRFAAEATGKRSQRSVEPGDSDVSSKKAIESHQKHQRTMQSTGDGNWCVADSSKYPSKFGTQQSASSGSFHYKPLFVRQHSLTGTSLPGETLTSLVPIEHISIGNLGCGWGCTETPNRRKRRHDGAIIYYSGAPFFIDLAGDHDDVSPTPCKPSGVQTRQETATMIEPVSTRSTLSLSSAYRPHSAEPEAFADTDMDVNGDPGLDVGMPWVSERQFIEVRPLEPCGIGGVFPDDHFMVMVITARSKSDMPDRSGSRKQRLNSDQNTDSIINRLASISNSLPVAQTNRGSFLNERRHIEIVYISGRIRRLAPVPLPPPAIFFPIVSTDTSSETMSRLQDEYDMAIPEERRSCSAR